MNKFYISEYAKALDEQTAFEQLILQVNANPKILDTLSLEQLIKINRYYEECIRQKEDQLRRLKNPIS
ncbi:MAG: hypothetical protein IKF09_09950 [Clostridiales bacterium]|nr:hypothetical protein [Clostridiales bacterium]